MLDTNPSFLFKFGKSPLSLHCSPKLGKALQETTKQVLQSQPDFFKTTWELLQKRFTSQEVGFFNSPSSSSISQSRASVTLAKKILDQKKLTDCLFIGIGGSSLGPLSLLEALQKPIDLDSQPHQALRFHFLENPDPIDWQLKISHLNPHRTLVCVVTKSGTTFETLALALLAFEWLQKKKSHLLFITDPHRGDLLKLAQAEKIPTLSIHPSIGGRFSLFSPVGLFPTALAGFSVARLLQGAREIRSWIESTPPEHNILFGLAWMFIQHFESHPIHLCMPYSTRLRFFGDWFVQLWGESLGKEKKGFTPLAALGATAQHSILQLLRDGPQDKITFFLRVQSVPNPVLIPSLKLGGTNNTYSAFELLEGHSLHHLLHIEQEAIAQVLEGQGHPHLTWSLRTLDEQNLGALYFIFCTLTAILGSLWKINPFDQPGVEEGKIYIKKSLSQI